MAMSNFQEGPNQIGKHRAAVTESPPPFRLYLPVMRHGSLLPVYQALPAPHTSAHCA